MYHLLVTGPGLLVIEKICPAACGSAALLVAACAGSSCDATFFLLLPQPEGLPTFPFFARLFLQELK